jgi:four helix bundle protein
VVVDLRFEELPVWERSRALVQSIYAVTKKKPFAGDFALKDQIRRAAISIPSNIAEGYERDGSRELLQFLSHAKGSCGEVRAQLALAADQGYLSDDDERDLRELCIEISKMLAGWMRHIRNTGFNGSKKL